MLTHAKQIIIELEKCGFQQVREWLHSLGIFDMQGSVVQDDEEPDDGALPLHYTEDSIKNRCLLFKAINLFGFVDSSKKCCLNF